MIQDLFSNPAAFVIELFGIILAIGVHEAAHSFMADRLGDPTPRALGQATFNPFAHIDPIGLLAIILTGFGWGKPSVYDPYNLRDPQKDSAKIALAGSASNLLMAAGFALLYRLPGLGFLSSIFALLVVLNINLAVFNLIPVPPLDGSKIFLKSNPFRQQSSFLLLFLLVVPIVGGYSIASLIISPISRFLLHLLLP